MDFVFIAVMTVLLIASLGLIAGCSALEHKK
jgi:hypothetical protein